MIEISHLVKRYADGAVAINDLSLRLSKRITCILGKNGAGKTTLIRIMSTQLMPTSGSVIINGHDVVNDAAAVRDIISSIPQEVKVMGIATPYDHVSMYLHARGLPGSKIDKASEKALRELDLWRVRDKCTADLSGGMRRKVFVAMAIASGADVIFLDEPTTGLDPISRLEVWSSLRKLGCEIIVTTHYMEEAKELSEEVVLVDHGKVVVQGGVDELLGRFHGRVRAEGPSGDYLIGGLHISYVTKARAEKLVEKGYTIKQVTLEDILITSGGGSLAD